MKLSAGLLSDCLRENYEIAAENIISEERIYERLSLQTDEALFLEGRVYIVKGSDLPEKPFVNGRCAVVSIGMPRTSNEQYLSGICDYYQLNKDVPIAEVCECVQDAFEKYRNWYEKLLEMMMHAKSLQEIFNASLPVFENPIYMHDENYKFLAAAEGADLPGPPDVYGISLNNGWLSASEIRILAATPGFEKTFETTKVSCHIDKGDYIIIYKNIRHNDCYKGRVFVAERVRTIKKGDYALLDLLTHLIEMTFYNRYYVFADNYRVLEQQLVKMLNKEASDIKAVKDGLDELGWRAKDSYFCFQVQLRDVDVAMHTNINICELLESSLKSAYIFPYAKNIAALAHTTDDAYTRPGELTRLAEELEGLGLYAGASQIFHGIKNFPRYYIQTDIALKYGVKENPQDRVHYFTDYSFEYMTDRCVDKMSPDMFCPPELQRLMDHDRKNGTAFTETLRVYLENQSRPSKAIKKLYLHRSTFAYQIERIKDILGADLEDSETVLHLLMAFRLIKKG